VLLCGNRLEARRRGGGGDEWEWEGRDRETERQREEKTEVSIVLWCFKTRLFQGMGVLLEAVIYRFIVRGLIKSWNQVL
jgi:hypothetical protein